MGKHQLRRLLAKCDTKDTTSAPPLSSPVGWQPFHSLPYKVVLKSSVFDSLVDTSTGSKGLLRGRACSVACAAPGCPLRVRPWKLTFLEGTPVILGHVLTPL